MMFQKKATDFGNVLKICQLIFAVFKICLSGNIFICHTLTFLPGVFSKFYSNQIFMKKIPPHTHRLAFFHKPNLVYSSSLSTDATPTRHYRRISHIFYPVRYFLFVCYNCIYFQGCVCALSRMNLGDLTFEIKIKMLIPILNIAL